MNEKRILPNKKSYAWLAWTPGQMKKLPDALLEAKKEKDEAIKNIPDNERTFENTIFALEASSLEMQKTASQLHLLASVSPKKPVREAALTALEDIEKKSIEVAYDPEMYEAVKACEKNITKKDLTEPEKKLLTETRKQYERMGFHLPEKKQARVLAIFQEIATLSSRFQKNVNDSEGFILLEKNELDGLPQNYINSLSKKGGKYQVTLAYPDYFPFMQNAENEQKRKELSDKFRNRGGEENLEILSKLAELRREVGDILGYETYVDYRTEMRVAKTADNAFTFVEDLLAQLREGVKNEVGELRAMKRKHLGGSQKLESHDLGFYSEMLKKEKYAVGSEQLREYFPLEKVKSGMFRLYEEVFGIKISKKNSKLPWHKDVEMYELADADGTALSHFFLDLHPRQGKFGHAAAFPFEFGRRIGYEEGTGYQAPAAALVCNFAAPKKNSPSLLSHGEVQTFFHEFGHVIHQCLTKARFASQSGFSVAWDFVEAPSQMLENWTWSPEVLKNYITEHKTTGESIDDVLLENLLASRNHQVCYDSSRQLVLALFDLTIHTKKTNDVNRLFKRLHKKHLFVEVPENTRHPASIGHFAGGYDAGYYGYMYSLVYAADMYTAFEKNGGLSPEVGARYRTEILERGSERDEKESVKTFLGRTANNKAFLRKVGVK